jgi:hypothetical protein
MIYGIVYVIVGFIVYSTLISNLDMYFINKIVSN